MKSLITYASIVIAFIIFSFTVEASTYYEFLQVNNATGNIGTLDGSNMDATRFTSNFTGTLNGVSARVDICAGDDLNNLSIWNDTGGGANSKPDTRLYTFTQSYSCDAGVWRGYNESTGYSINNNTIYWIAIGHVSGAGNKAYGCAGGCGSPTGYNYEDTYDGVWNFATITTLGQNLILYTKIPEATPNNVSLVLINKNNSKLYSPSSVDEMNPFFIGANYTNSTHPVLNGECNFSATNISAHFAVESTQNISFSSGTQLNLTFTESNTSAIYDVIRFRTCKNNPTAKIQVYINNALYDTVSPVSCPAIFQYANTTSSYLTSTNNITLKFLQSATMIKNSRDEVLVYERDFSTHSENMMYNSTTSLYAFKNHTYSYPKSQTNNVTISLNCNNTNSSIVINVSNLNLTAEVRIIDNNNFSDGITVESSNQTAIELSIFGDFLSYISFNVTNSTGTLIKSVSDYVMMLNQSELSKIGIYNISVFVKDDENTGTSLKKYFSINDSVTPSINFISPSEDNSSHFHRNISESLSAQFYDVNLFAYEVLIYDSFGSLVNNFTLIDINSTTVNFLESATFNNTGTHLINVTVYDDHTALEIEDFNKVYTDNDRLISFEIENIRDREKSYHNITVQYTGKYDVTKALTEKFLDRYTFGFDISYNADINLKEVENTFLVSCDDLHFRPNSKHVAHFVCFGTDKKWLDFDTSSVIDWYVKNLGDNSYEITLISKPSDLRFNSIGNLNMENEVITFGVTEQSVSSVTLFNFDFSNSAHVLLLLGLIILYLGCNFIGFMFGNIIMLGLGMFFGFMLGVILSSISMIFAIVFFIISIILYWTMSKLMI